MSASFVQRRLYDEIECFELRCPHNVQAVYQYSSIEILSYMLGEEAFKRNNLEYLLMLILKNERHFCNELRDLALRYFPNHPLFSLPDPLESTCAYTSTSSY